MIDIKKIRWAAPLLPPPGDEVVAGLCDEVEKLGKLLDEAVEWVADAECMSPEDLRLRTDLIRRIKQERERDHG